MLKNVFIEKKKAAELFAKEEIVKLWSCACSNTCIARVNSFKVPCVMENTLILILLKILWYQNKKQKTTPLKKTPIQKSLIKKD